MRAGTGLVVVLRCRICRSPARRPVPATSFSPSVLRRAATTAQMPARRLSAVESSTLLQALEAGPDPRERRGRRHPLYSMLYLALGAVLDRHAPRLPLSAHAQPQVLVVHRRPLPTTSPVGSSGGSPAGDPPCPPSSSNCAVPDGGDISSVRNVALDEAGQFGHVRHRHVRGVLGVAEGPLAAVDESGVQSGGLGA